MHETFEPDDHRLLDDNVQLFHDLAKKISTDEAIPKEERFKQACEAYENTLKVADEVSYSDEKLLDIIIDYADYLASSKDYAYAKCKYRDAIVICDRLASIDPEKFDKEVASILNKRASVLHADKRYDEADAEYCEARVRYDSLNEKHPGQFDFLIADNLFCLAKLHEDMERFESAEDEYRASADIFRRIASEHPDAKEQIKIIEERLKVFEESRAKAEETKAGKTARTTITPKASRTPKATKARKTSSTVETESPPIRTTSPSEATSDGCCSRRLICFLVAALIAVFCVFSCVRQCSKKTKTPNYSEAWLSSGIRQYTNKDYDKAFYTFNHIVVFYSNSVAMCYIGLMYENGYGRPKNYSEAKKWYARAASLGDTWAARRLDELVRKSETQNTSNNNSKPFKDFHTLLDK